MSCKWTKKKVRKREKVKSEKVFCAQMHPFSRYVPRSWVCCRSSYSCWFVNCLSPTRCHLSVVPQSPSHVGRPAWRLPTSLTCSNRPHLRHTPPDPSGINSSSLIFRTAITTPQSVLCERREGAGGGDGKPRGGRGRQMRCIEKWMDGWTQ